MATKVFQRGNYIVLDKNGNETIVPIDNFDYDFVTPTSILLKDAQEQESIPEALGDIQDESGTPIGTKIDVDNYFSTFEKKVSGGTGGGTASDTNQLTQITEAQATNDHLTAKKIGHILDLEQDQSGNWAGFPIGVEALELKINGVNVRFEGGGEQIEGTKQLAEFFNNIQNKLWFGEYEEDTKLYFVGATVDVPELEQIDIDESLAVGAVLEYPAPFAATSDAITGALHQSVILSQETQQILRTINEKIKALQPTKSLSYSGNAVKNLTTDVDVLGDRLNPGDRGDIRLIQDLGAGSVSFSFNGATPITNVHSTISGRQTVNVFYNVNFDNFRIKGSSGGSDYAIIVNIYN